MTIGLQLELETVSYVRMRTNLNPWLKGTLCDVNGASEGQGPGTRARVKVGCPIRFMGKIGL